MKHNGFEKIKIKS